MISPSPQGTESVVQVYIQKVIPKPFKVDESITRSCVSGQQDLVYPDNSISTSKYTFYNFIPKNLGEQFSKMANVYFLLLVILQIVPAVSISDGVPTILIPLTFIVILTAVKDFFEDYKRKQSDRAENTKLARKYDTATRSIVEVQWKDLRVGDVIKVEKLEYFPADVLLVGSSEPKGICYIETKNLDGETNMKQKNAYKVTQDFFDIPSHVSGSTLPDFVSNQFSLEFEGPNVYLYQFQGTAYMDKSLGKELKERENLLSTVHTQIRSGKEPLMEQLERLSHLKDVTFKSTVEKLSINNSAFILRGSSLQNTRYLYGLVTYTGHDTKIMRNSFKARAKKSQLEKEMSTQIIYIFIVQMLICFFGAVYYTIWYINCKENVPYLGIDWSGTTDHSFTYNLFVRLGNWILMFGNFVPISLLVTLEMVKFIQAIIIAKDHEYMTSYANGLVTPCVVQSSNLNEELGQISVPITLQFQYVFSDKTGTLTCNLMEFKKICINGISYGEVKEGDANYIKDITGFTEVTNVDFRDNQLVQALHDDSNAEKDNIMYHHYLANRKLLILLGLCHSIITETKDGKLLYNASSPDELALVNFARFLGCEYQGTDENNNITITWKGQTLQYQLFHILEFDSTRKRNSVIIKDLQNNQYKILTKGADSIIFDRSDPVKNGKELVDLFQGHLSEYGKIGLRTLLLAEKNLTEAQFNEWNERYRKASTQMEGREEAQNALQDEIERDLIILGATAIEDKLQDEVGATIASLRVAGIKVWVLTGDKVETAINIGYSCQLISPDMTLIIVEERDADLIIQKLEDLSVLDSANPAGYGLVITGDALAIIFKEENKRFQRRMMELANRCESVLCCRVSPAQKQQVVSVVRYMKPEVSTLAIGDGANDVSMITAAHVGVGIKGVEGQQASRASDYAIGEFKMLRPLLFVHGRESYRRNSTLILFNFFKNIVLVFPQFWLSAYNNFSGQTPYDQYIYQLFNVFYTFMPIIIYAVFDEQYSKRTLFDNKENYYQIGPKRERFSTLIFWSWFCNATAQSIIIAFFTIYSLNYMVSTDGYTLDFWGLGTSVFGSAVVTSCLKILLISNTWTPAWIFFFLGSPFIYMLTLLVVMSQPTSSSWDIVAILFSTGNFHWNNILVIVTTTGLDYGLSTLFLSSLRKADECPTNRNNRVQPASEIYQQQLVDQEQTHLKNDQEGDK